MPTMLFGVVGVNLIGQKNKAAEGRFWDHSDLQPLVFDYAQYQAEIARVISEQ